MVAVDPGLHGRFKARASKEKQNNLKQFKNELTVGRRIIDVDFFGKQFDRGCLRCGSQLKWENVVKETVLGLCSIFHFQCAKCLKLTKISTSDTLETEKYSAKRKPYAANVKAALAMVHAGVGEYHMNAIFTTIGLPPTTFRTYKKSERTVGPMIERVAEVSCQKACAEEKMMETNHQVTFEEALAMLESFDEDTTSPDPPSFEEHSPSKFKEVGDTPLVGNSKPQNMVDVTVSQDASWSRRARSMNSLSGWGHVIGLKTKRCLNFSTRKKSCMKCSHYSRLGKPVPNHDCRKNWSHSAKAMEDDIAVTLHRQASEHGLNFKAVIGDEDSSSIKHIREQVNSDLEKYSDLNHIKRTLTRKLEDLHKTHKSMSEKVRGSFIKNFTYAVHQNKINTEEKMRTSLLAIVPHMFGDHEKCDISWCNILSGKNHSNLPYGKPLSDVLLKDALNNLLEPFIANPKKLMTSGSTQVNESLNNVAWSKAPKIRNYNQSESFDYRCAAAVCQFNEGCKYVQDVCDTGNLSPRKETQTYVQKKDRQRHYFQTYKARRLVKKRRVALKKERKQKDLTSDIKFGTSYKTDCLFTDETLDTFRIPDAESESPLKTEPEEIQEVYFDIETTKLGNDAEIIQISAYLDEKTSFDKYIMPTGNISKMASEITGLTVHISNGNRELHYHRKPVMTVNIKQGLCEFIEWLNRLTGRNFIIIAHNGKRFDFPLLIRDLEIHGLQKQFENILIGLCDSLPLLKEVLPEQRSYKLGSVYNTLFQADFDCHNSMNDVKALERIFYSLAIDKSITVKHSQKISSFVSITKKKRGIQRRVHDLEQKLSQNGSTVVSKRIMEKICSSGINFEMLEKAYERNVVFGISSLFCERVAKGVRVTNRKSIIRSINNFFHQKNACSD